MYLYKIYELCNLNGEHSIIRSKKGAFPGPFCFCSINVGLAACPIRQLHLPVSVKHTAGHWVVVHK